MIDEATASIIADALWNEELQGFSTEELGDLALFEYEDDPDVEFFDLEFTEEAGMLGHGTNTEEEMLQTVSL